MTGVAFDRIRSALEARGRATKVEPFGLMAQCPAHDDGRPSMSMRNLPGRVRLHCFAGCEDNAILDALGLKVSDMFDEPKGVDYRYTDGRVVHRSPDKRFRQSGNTAGSALYVGGGGGLERVRAAMAAGEPVYLLEGEQDADAATVLGSCGVSAAMGAGNFSKADVEPLRGAHVIAVPDEDEPGAKWLEAVRTKLAGVAASLAVKAPATGKDLTDHYVAGHGLDDLVDRPESPAVLAMSSLTAPSAGQGSGGGALFTRDGMDTVAAVAAVRALGPIAVGPGGLWAYVDGVWQPSAEGLVRHRAHTVLGARSRRSHVDTIIDVLASEPATLREDNLDTSLLNLTNGLLNWRTGQLHPHTAGVFAVPRIPVRWDPQSACPAVVRFLGEVFGVEAVDFALEVVGYCLFNDQPLHKAILLFGHGRNGKGTFIRLLTALLGEPNVSTVDPQSLDGNRFAIAELHGRLANLAGDVDPRRFESTAAFKQATGGDRLKAERKYGQPFSFTCRATIIAAYNALPTSNDNTEGFFSRCVIVPMPGYFPPGVADDGLSAKLTSPTELEGLLVLAVDGLRSLMARGRFAPPAVVQAATEEYRENADPVRAFITDELLIRDYSGNDWLPRTEVYAQYQAWCERNGHHPYASTRFYPAFNSATAPHEALVATERKRRGIRGYLLRCPRGQGGSGGRSNTLLPRAAEGGVSELPPAAPLATVTEADNGINPAAHGIPAQQTRRSAVEDDGDCPRCSWPVDSNGHEAACHV